MRDLMMLYGVTLGRRYTTKDKNYFQQEATERYKALGYDVQAKCAKSKQGNLCNLVAGDLAKAKVVVVAAYDTPSKSMLPGCRYFPLHYEKNLLETRIELVFRIVLMMLSCACALLLFRQFLVLEGVARFGCLAGAVILLILGLLSLRSRGNKVNFSRNSASLAAMAKAAELLGKEARKKAAFVFLDQQISSFSGMKAFQESVEGVDFSGKTVLVLDCLAHGNVLVLARRDSCARHMKRFVKAASGLKLQDKSYTEETRAQNIVGVLDNTLFLVSGQPENGEFVIRNTRSKKDVRLDIERLEEISRTIVRYINES